MTTLAGIQGSDRVQILRENATDSPQNHLSLFPTSNFGHSRGKQQAGPWHRFISVSSPLSAQKGTESSWKTSVWSRSHGSEGSLGRRSRSGMPLACVSVHTVSTAAFVCGFLMHFNQASWKESKAIMWCYFDFAVSQQLLENFIFTAETSSMWKKCGNWECIDLHFVGLFLYSSLGIYCWLLEETGYWVRWSDPAMSSDVLTINNGKSARGFMKIAGSREIVGLKILWLCCRLEGSKCWRTQSCRPL